MLTGHDGRARRRRLLYLGHNLPFPPHEGALIRSYHTLRLLSREYDVSGIFFFRRSAHPTEESRERAVGALSEFASVAVFPIEQEFSRVRFAWDHARSILTRSPYTRWAHESREALAKLREWARLESFDVIHVDSLDLMAYLPELPAAPTVLVHHNTESALLRRRAEVESGFKRSYIRLQAALVERAERKWCERVDLNVAVSQADAVQIRRLAPGADVLVIPNGVDTHALRPSHAVPSDGLLFIGGYSWFPNADAMEYFAGEILPLIRRGRPDTRVRWIGKATQEATRRFASLGVEMLGYVDDIRPFVEEARCVIVPLRIGGGTRLKILDAWALGKAVVSTAVGCEGLDTRHGENILVADTTEEFAVSTISVLEDDELRRSLDRKGRDTAVHSYDWESLGEIMLRRYRTLPEPGFSPKARR